MADPMAAEGLDFAALLRPDDGIIFGQACSEPLTLTERLAAQAGTISDRHGKLRVFLAGSYSGVFRPEVAASFGFSSYGALGDAGVLASQGLLDVYPAHYSQLPGLFATGAWRCDVALVQLSPPDRSGQYSMGVANDFQLAVIRSARTVIAEVNARMPWTFGAELPKDVRIDHIVDSDRALVEVQPVPANATAERIADHVASLIPDGATLQMGVGGVIGAICDRLSSHQDLGIHSGIIGDAVVDLMEKGVVNNRLKSGDAGTTVTGSLFGSRRLFDFAHRNPAIRIVPTSVTHGPAVLSSLRRLHAINSALQVDLGGQVNAEVGSGRYVGAVGGQVDYLRAAANCEGGRSIIALPSTAANGKISRIVASLNAVPTTSPRSDVDCIVTEWGVAMLRGLHLRDRAKALIRIAHPDFRDELAQAAELKGIV